MDLNAAILFSYKAPSDSLHHQYGLYSEILSTTFYAKVLRCLHPTVRGYYPKHGNTDADCNHEGSKKCALGLTRPQPKSMMPRNPAL